MIGLVEIRRRRIPFLLIMSIVTLVSYLVMMVNGLGDGLKFVSASAITALNADAITYSDRSGLSVLFSEFQDTDLVRLIDEPGVERIGGLGYLSANYVRQDGKLKPAAFFGFDPLTLGAPEVLRGRDLQYFDTDGVLADRRFLDSSDLDVGDRITVTLRLRERTFVIRGVIDEGYFFFQPVLYVLRSTWAEMLYGAGVGPGAFAGSQIPDAGEVDHVAAGSSARDVGVPPLRLPHAGEVDEVVEAQATAPPRPDFATSASIVLVTGNDLPGRKGDGFEFVSKETAFNHVEGVAIQQATVTALSAFGYVIGAVVVGVFFYVLTMQKVQQIGMLKAVGASNFYVVRQTLVQVLVLGCLGVLISIGAAIGTTWLLGRDPDAPPVLLRESTMAITGGLVLLTAAVGTLLSARQVMRIDPIIALGQQQ